MKFIKLLIVLVIGLAAGFGGGFYLGKEAGIAEGRVKNAGGEMVTLPPDTGNENSSEPATAPKTTITESAKAPVDPPKQPAGEMLEFAITPNMQSAIMFTGFKEVAGQKIGMEGGFANFEGVISGSLDAPEKAVIEVTVDVPSIFTTDGILTNVLKGDDWFQAEKFPKATFKAIEITQEGDGYMVTGALTIKDKRQGIKFPVSVEFTDKGLKVKARDFKVDRKAWELGYDDFKDAIILSDALINFEILAEKK